MYHFFFSLKRIYFKAKLFIKSSSIKEKEILIDKILLISKRFPSPTLITHNHYKKNTKHLDNL